MPAEEEKAREDWLRYSRWENRHKTQSRHSETKLPDKEARETGKSVLPEHPGLQAVEPSTQFTVPAWGLRNREAECPRPQEYWLDTGPCLSSFRSRLGCGRAWGSRGLGPMVWQTGPSPSSGNYFQPATRFPGASGDYYAGDSPWQIPVIIRQGGFQDYWGPQGNPFKK